MKVADSITCTNFAVHCANPGDRVFFGLQGAGDLFMIDETCEQFMKFHADWSTL